MKTRLLISLFLLLSISPTFGQGKGGGDAVAQTARDVMHLCGLQGPCADILVGQMVHDNAASVSFSNAAGTDTIPALLVDAADDTILSADAGDVIKLRPSEDDNRLFTFSAASDAALATTWGDGGTTAVQIWTVSASTADADDDSSLVLCGGGAAGGTRGASITLPGEEVAGGSDITYNAGTADTHIFQVAGVTEMTVAGTSVTLAGAGDLNFNVGLATVAFQEAVAGTACSGTATLNGTTAVTTSTTCATTGSRILISKTSDGSGSAAADQVGAWATNIVNGTSFDVDSADAADSATVNWVIFHEAP